MRWWAPNQFLTFAEEYNFGSELVTIQMYPDRKSQSYTDVFMRRDPSSLEHIRCVRTLTYNYDACHDFHLIHPKYLEFSELGSDKEFTLRKEADFVVSLVSMKENFLLTGPPTLFFLLSYVKKPFSEVKDEDLQEIDTVASWIIKLLVFCKKVEKKLGYHAHFLYIAPSLVMNKKRVNELRKFIHSADFAKSPLRFWIEEYWEFQLHKDETFEWDPVFLREESTKQNYKSWKNNIHIRRSNKLGDDYSLMLIEDATRNHPEMWRKFWKEFYEPLPKWDSESIEFPDMPDSKDIRYDTLLENRQNLPEDHPAGEFFKWYKQNFGRALNILEVFRGMILCEEESKLSSPTRVILKINSQEYFFNGYGTDILTLRMILNKRRNVRFFAYSPKSYIREEGIDKLYKLAIEEMDSAKRITGVISDFVGYLNMQNIFRVQLLHQNFLGGYGFMQYYQTRKYYENIEALYQFNEESGKYEELSLNKETLTDFLLQFHPPDEDEDEDIDEDDYPWEERPGPFELGLYNEVDEEDIIRFDENGLEILDEDEEDED